MLNSALWQLWILFVHCIKIYVEPWIRLTIAFFNPCSIKSLSLKQLFPFVQLRALTKAGKCSPPHSGKPKCRKVIGKPSPLPSTPCLQNYSFYGQSEVLTPNTDNVKAIYISCYIYTFSMTEQPAAPKRGVQSSSVIMHVPLNLSFTFTLPGRLITGVGAAPRDCSGTVLCQPETGKLAWHHLVLNETL